MGWEPSMAWKLDKPDNQVTNSYRVRLKTKVSQWTSDLLFSKVH